MLSRTTQLLLALLAVITFATASQATLIGYYKLDDSTLPTANATVGPNGTYENFAPGDLGQAPAPKLGAGTSVNLNNPGVQTINLGSNPYSAASAVSMAMWVKMDNTTADHTFASIGAFAGSQPLIFWRDDDAGGGVVDTIAVMVTGTDNVERRATAPSGTLNNTGWHHVAFTYQANSATGLIAYVDGKPVATQSTNNVTFSTTALDLKLGNTTITPVTAKQFFGNMDDVSLWNNALAQNEISYLSRGGLTSLLTSSGANLISVTNGDDSFVESGNSTLVNQNFGSSTILQSKFAGDSTGDFNRKDYVRFNLPDLSNTQLADARFTLRVPTDANTSLGSNTPVLDWTFNVYGLKDGDAGEGWDESLITWNNAPGNIVTGVGSGNGLDPMRTTFLGTFTPSLTGYGVGNEIVLSGAALLNFIEQDTDGQVTFIVTRVEPQTSGSINTIVHQFASFENADVLSRPSLQLVTLPVPEPATIGLVGLAGLALLRRRRAA